jgi:hypothetical protein
MYIYIIDMYSVNESLFVYLYIWIFGYLDLFEVDKFEKLILCDIIDI